MCEFGQMLNYYTTIEDSPLDNFCDFVPALAGFREGDNWVELVSREKMCSIRT